MKKLFSLLILFSLCSKAQISIYSPIWTYTGSNIQYTNGSVIAGSLTTASTLSVGSTATVTGDFNNASRIINNNFNTTNSQAKFGSFELQSYAVNNAWLSDNVYYNGGFRYRENGSASSFYFSNGDLFIHTAPSGVAGNAATMTNRLMVKNTGAVGIGTASPTATLDVVGNAKVSSTFSLGSANLTGGNTGTVAVLSDALFPLQFSQGSSSPADASTYYFGQMSAQQSGSPWVGIVYIPYNSTLVGWSFSSYVSSVAGSAETATLSVRINNTTDVQLSSAINYSLASGYNNYNGTGLSTSIAAGDYLNIKLVTPTWVTNPTNIFSGVTLWFVRRS